MPRRCPHRGASEEPVATVAADEGKNAIEGMQLEDAGAADFCDRREDAEGSERRQMARGAMCFPERFWVGLGKP